MKLLEKGELQLLWPFYLDALISTMFFFTPVFGIIFFKNLNFNLFQIGLLYAITSLSGLIFEMPTGAIADLYGRKFSVLLSCILSGIGFLLIYFLNNFYLILLVFAFLGFANSFNSGAREAWITDLVKSKKKNFLHKYFVKSYSLDSFGLIISGILGAFIVKLWGVSVIWIIAFLSYIISFILLSFGEEIFIKRETTFKKSFKKINQQTKISLNYSKNHSVLFYFLIASSIFVFGSNMSADLSWIPLLKGFNFPDYAFGYMWSAMSLMSAVAPLIGSKFYKKNKEKNFILFFTCLWALFSLLIFFVNGIVFAFFILLSLEFFDYSKRPVQRVYFHRFIPSKLRATIGSVESMLFSLVGIISLPITGFLVDKIGPKYTIFVSGLVIIPAIILYLIIKEKK